MLLGPVRLASAVADGACPCLHQATQQPWRPLPSPAPFSAVRAAGGCAAARRATCAGVLPSQPVVAPLGHAAAAATAAAHQLPSRSRASQQGRGPAGTHSSRGGLSGAAAHGQRAQRALPCTGTRARRRCMAAAHGLRSQRPSVPKSGSRLALPHGCSGQQQRQRRFHSRHAQPGAVSGALVGVSWSCAVLIDHFFSASRTNHHEPTTNQLLHV